MSEPPDDELPAAPEQRDKLDREVALGKLKAKLFDRNVAVKIGRYHLLEVVGRGGMGVVWGAWDPELDRKVAIKLVKPSLASARERILVEGQALAKLSHPNVVPIYDVGVFEEQVFLVMEWVRGANLRAYAAAKHTVREVVAVYRQAGEGLAAAHAAGLVHRDFKPDNAMRGEDGRVRVLDFGLAQLEDGDRGAGTPRYMAPEQKAGEAVSPACDQYAFCVSLREALPEVPRWIEAIVVRGTQDDPAARFHSMAELLHALGRDPATIRRRRIAAALGVVALGGAFVIGRAATRSSEIDPCSGAEREIATAWGDPARAAVSAHLDAGDETTGVLRDLDGYATSWAASHRTACTAHQASELTPALYERRLGCLARSKAALGAVAELLSAVAPANVENALLAARSLPDSRRCADQDAAQIAPPSIAVAPAVDAAAAKVEYARVLAIAADPAAVTAAEAAVKDAEATTYAPVIARALLVQGRAELALEREHPEVPLARSVQLAIEGGDDATAIEAYARLVYAKEDKDVDGLSLIEPLARRAGPLGVFGRALLYNNLGTSRLARGDREGARVLLERAEHELPADPTQIDIELVCVSQNLGLVAASSADRERALLKAIKTFDRVLGPRHTSTLGAHVVYGFGTANGDHARERLASACETYRRYQANHGAAIAWCEYELAWLTDEIDDRATTTAALEYATTDPLHTERKIAAVATAYLQAMSATPTEARAGILALRALGQTLATAPEVFTRVSAADAYVAAARSETRLGDAASAATAWSAALAILEREKVPMLQRRLANVRAAVARSLVATQPTEAHRLGELARTWYTAAGGYEAALRDLP